MHLYGFDRLFASEIDAENPVFDSVSGRRFHCYGFERRAPARDQNEIETGLGEAEGELAADSVRGAGNNGPGSVTGEEF